MSAHEPGVSDMASPSPIARQFDPLHNAHIVQFYAEDSFPLDGLSRFVGTPPGAGDAAMVISTRAHRDGNNRQRHNPLRGIVSASECIGIRSAPELQVYAEYCRRVHWP